MTFLTYVRTAERPEAVLTLPDDVDVSAGYTFSLKVGTPSETALVTKTTNITGAAGSVTVAWTAGELAALDPGLYNLELTATVGGFDRHYHWPIRIRDVIT
jgi:hypothetical protein